MQPHFLNTILGTSIHVFGRHVALIVTVPSFWRRLTIVVIFEMADGWSFCIHWWGTSWPALPTNRNSRHWLQFFSLCEQGTVWTKDGSSPQGFHGNCCLQASVSGVPDFILLYFIHDQTSKPIMQMLMPKWTTTGQVDAFIHFLFSYIFY